MNTLASILAPVDFSPCSTAAFQQAARIAAWNRSSLEAMHVVPLHTYGAAIDMLAPSLVLPPELPDHESLRSDARERWRLFARAVSAPETTKFHVAIGNPRDEILERVRRSAPDLLVVGAYGELGSPGELGPTATACVQRAPTQVLVVREGRTGPFRSILACVDFTDASRLALDQAVRAAAQDNAALHVLHVYEDPWRGRHPKGPAQTVPDFPERYNELVVKHLRHFCEPMAHELNAVNARFSALEFPSHGRGIVEFIKRQGCDLVVLGVRAKWNLRDFVWGSTAERVMLSAPCSALCVKPVAHS